MAPSHRNSPQAISHGFPSAHPAITPVSLLFSKPLTKLFHTVSLPSTLSSLPYRFFPPELSPSYLTRFPFRPPCRHSRIAPSHRISLEAISHGFPSVHPVVTPVSLLPTKTLPKLFHTVSLPSTLSSLPYIAPSHRSSPRAISHGFFPSTLSSFHYRSFRPERSSPQAISHGFPSVHPLVTPVSSFPPEPSPTRFPFPRPCHHSSNAPSHPAGSPRGFPSVHPVVTSASLPRDKVPKREPKHRRCLWE